MRSRHGGHAEDKVQTMISTDVMILATIRHSPPATHHPPPGAWHLQLSKFLDRAPRSIHGSIYSSEIGSVLPFESVLGSVEPSRLGVCHRVQLGVYLRPSRELTWERTVKQARSVPSSAIRSVLESMLGSVLENVLGGVLGSVLGVYLGVS